MSSTAPDDKELVPQTQQHVPLPLKALASKPGYYEFDTHLFPFQNTFAEMIDCKSEQLPQLHDFAESEIKRKRSEYIMREANVRGMKAGTREYKMYVLKESLRACVMPTKAATYVRNAAMSASQYQQFVEMYHQFVREVILPLFDEPTGKFAVQKEPSIRVSTPGDTVLGRRDGESDEQIGMHRDADYGHQASEVTFVVPLTPMFGSNSVWAESSNGCGDFAPFTMKYGFFHRWHSAQSRHFNQLNQTGSTRVSIDFRVIPMSHYKEEEIANCSHRFRVGEYFTILEV